MMAINASVENTPIENGGTVEDIEKLSQKTGQKTGQKISQNKNQKLKSTLPKTNTLVWAVDAFPDEIEHERNTALALQATFPDHVIHPVYILSEESFTDRPMTSFFQPALKPMALKALKRFLTDASVLNLKAPRVLIEGSASQAACARRLLRYSRKIGAQAIALGSRGRTGLARLLLGSFSESMIQTSSLPLFVTGPFINYMKSQPQVIVFPTDFSPSCEQAFPHILKLAQSMNAEIHLFHNAIYSHDPVVQTGVNMLGGGWVSAEAYMNSAGAPQSSKANEWKKLALQCGIKTHFISENFSDPTSEAIVQYSGSLNETPSMIAMVSQTGPLASALLGSVTRDVIRMSTCPVYIARA